MGKAVEDLRNRFDVLYGRWLASISDEGWPSDPSRRIVRSAAKIEQAFGGLNSQLWDDPFEWTLPETLDSMEKIRGYLEEVRAAGASGFARLRSENDLDREIWTPWGLMEIRKLLEKTFQEAEGFLDGA